MWNVYRRSRDFEKLNVRTEAPVTEYNLEPGHGCSKCGYLLDESACEIFDTLPDLEMSLSKDVKMSLFYIAGYVTRKDGPLSDEDLLNDTGFYYREYGDFVKKLDRGSLNIPLDNTVQWVFFCFIMFNHRRKINRLETGPSSVRLD